VSCAAGGLHPSTAAATTPPRGGRPGPRSRGGSSNTTFCSRVRFQMGWIARRRARGPTLMGMPVQWKPWGNSTFLPHSLWKAEANSSCGARHGRQLKAPRAAFVPRRGAKGAGPRGGGRRAPWTARRRGPGGACRSCRGRGSCRRTCAPGHWGLRGGGAVIRAGAQAAALRHRRSCDRAHPLPAHRPRTPSPPATSAARPAECPAAGRGGRSCPGPAGGDGRVRRLCA
jgi:hypothetical protein